MTSAARVNGDIRMVAGGLAFNEAIDLPATITATGREARDQFATVPGSVSASFALLAHVDFEDDPDLRPGGGFVGGRRASIVPYLAPGTITAAHDVRVALKQLPTSRDEIRRRLRWEAGLWWAPGAVFSQVGWEDESVYVWLDHLRENGPYATLALALAQAQFALRRMWARLVHGVGAPPAQHTRWWPSLSTQCGAVVVGRALLDLAAMLFRLVDATIASGLSSAAVPAPMRKIKILLEDFVRLVEDADRRPEAAAKRRLEKAVKTARTLLDAVAIFSVAPERLDLRWGRLHAELFGVSTVNATPFVRRDQAAFEARLNRLSAATIGTRLEQTVWPSRVRRSLLRLASLDPAIRIAYLDRVRGDLLYKLAMTGRLDRLYELFPWLAAPHSGFVNCAGGALGALATLVECARRLAIAREQKRELGDMLDDGMFECQRAAVRRLSVPVAREFWRSQVRIAATAGHGYVAGRALDHGALSHATVTAMMGGAYFSPDFPLTAARFGKLGWSLPVALRDLRTVASVQAVEQGRQVMRTNDHDDDLPRCNGMTLRRQLAETIVWAFRTGSAGRKGPARRQRAIDAAEAAGRPGAGVPLTAQGATNQLLLSMLLTIEIPIDDIVRDAIADNVVPIPRLTGEAARADKQQVDATRNSVDCDVDSAGQGVRNRAVNERSMTDERHALLRDLTWDVGRWPEATKLATGTFSDDLLDNILRGRANLGQLTPVGALPLPLLWCAPLIDRERVHWIANGAPIGHAPTGLAAQAEGIALAVARAHAWAPNLHAKTLLTGHSINTACALFTGRSPITADLELAYSVK